MILKNIAPNVTYCGVDDLDTTRFEGLWPLPMGVSLNSYIIKGSDATALVDTVRVERQDAYMPYTGLEKAPDYLIVNHMEPDHSGLIPDMLRLYPNLKIVCNKVTVGMIRGYFGDVAEDRLLVVADGDTLKLGDDVTLKFVMTPMVHWPETMMTYLVEEKMLFSGDAFGCFGALQGGVGDFDIPDTDKYIPEMYRYYSNIVGKYSPFVQRALAKLKDVPVEYICSTHGPVWHKRVAEIISLYDKLSRMEGEDGIVLIYSSMYGNTRRLADMIAVALHEEMPEVAVKMYDPLTTDISDILADVWKYKGLIVGSPTYSMTLFPPVQSVADALTVRELKNRTLGVFGTYTWAPAALKKLEEWADALKIPVASALKVAMAPSDATKPEIEEFARKYAEAYRNSK